MLRVSIVAVSTVLLGLPLAARQGEGPRFDVVSIKPNNSPEPGGRNALESGSYSGIGVTLRRMIALAYLPVPTSLISGGPAWLTSDRFDVRARFTGNPPREQLQLMMRAMLADRFKLRMHRRHGRRRCLRWWLTGPVCSGRRCGRRKSIAPVRKVTKRICRGAPFSTPTG